MKNWVECSKKERIARWENVERVLKSLSPHQRRRHWNMANWGIATQCGTVACAAGHCGMDPWFRRRGLRLKPYRPEAEPIQGEVQSEIEAEALTEVGNGAFEGDINIETFFGEYGADQIFCNIKLRPVGKVIREVRTFIKHLKADKPEKDFYLEGEGA